ncbi:zinc-binding dehydrogenase [Streptomyces sp. NPDC005760]|uniref:zinc-binding dehydrogenase n=1 Tax=Streptomyces sp. NPDC005760 TaxID=3156718 RepID=UPI0033FD61EB
MLALVPTADPDEPVALETVAEPEPADGEAVVAVEAFSINRGELMRLYRPKPGWRPGRDVAGRVVRAAADGSGPQAGTRVVAFAANAGWAEQAAVPTTGLAELPDAVSAPQAAALPLAGLSALRLLRAAGAVAGRRVLLTGASGGVGHFLVELLAGAGAEVTAVTATPERGARLLELGAAAVVHDPQDAEGTFELALESVGGGSTRAALGKLGRRGRLIWFGGASREPLTLNFFDFFAGPESGTIQHFSNTDSDTSDGADLATLVSLVAAGRLHPEIGHVADWKRTAEALVSLRERRVRGKAVLTLGDVL